MLHRKQNEEEKEQEVKKMRLIFLIFDNKVFKVHVVLFLGLEIHFIIIHEGFQLFMQVANQFCVTAAAANYQLLINSSSVRHSDRSFVSIEHNAPGSEICCTEEGQQPRNRFTTSFLDCLIKHVPSA